MKFEITARDQDSQARTGFIETTRGKISTPVFMPDGKLGNVKTIISVNLKWDIQAEVILGNANHMYLRPGLRNFFRSEDFTALSG
jgi:queuine tRNA-ribosyltransferase